MNVKCSCHHCKQHIEFDDSYIGETVECPHCFQPTVLTPPEPKQLPASHLFNSKSEISPPQRKATVAQLDYIRALGGEPSPGLTISSATEMIDKLLKAPDVEQKKLKARKQRQLEEEDRRQRTAQNLRKDCEEAKQTLKTAVGDEEIKDATDALEDALFERMDFWKDTFNSPVNMNHPCEQSVKLYFLHGYTFKIPSDERIQRTLDALDEAYATWDIEATTSFFLTTEATFPDLLRKNIDFEDLEMDKKEWLHYNFRT